MEGKPEEAVTAVGGGWYRSVSAYEGNRESEDAQVG